ncbi:hypothetical protein MYAM1_000142 [Malassezia yamatoensis]|uniref:Protein IVY1 n=1 Tax=Malassezia yamatoensis TaxID=253288 RepID=A0AAJ5YNA1_9BASI|nr:hypothetical protein MYAM1_000142 [Malassezia yamatoensis]
MHSGVGSSAASIQSSGALTQSSSVRPTHCPDVYIRRADIEGSIQAYEQLLQASKAYTSTMLAMSKASSDLAQAMEDCSHVKGAHGCGPALQAACGLHYLKSNYEQVLCDTFWKEFSIPLLSQLDVYRSTVHERQMLHERAIAEKSQMLKQIEKKYQKENKRRTRDLNSFRLMLSELQEKVNDLEEIKTQHYSDALEYEEQTWDFVSSKVALLVRAQVEIAERLSSKASSDPVLESVAAAIPDPFNTYGPPKKEDEIFSILQAASASGLAAKVQAEAARTISASSNASEQEQESGPNAGHDTQRRNSRTALFSPRIRPQGEDHTDESPPSRAFLASSLHNQPSYSSLFGYRATNRAETEPEQDAMSTEDASKSHEDDQLHSYESETKGKSHNNHPSAPSRWPSDQGIW